MTLFRVDDISFQTCVGNYVRPEVSDFISMFHAFERSGTLPFSGSYSEQPQKIIEILNVISKVKQDIVDLENKKRMRQQPKVKRGR